MPTLLVLYGIRFFFYSNENNEPAHIHVAKGDANGKIWLVPSIQIAYLHNFTNSEIRTIESTISEYAESFKEKWNEYFGK